MSSGQPVVYKSPGVAAVLSFFITGLGQIYNGQIGKGLLMIVLYFVFWALCWLIIGIPFLVILWIWGIYNAYKTAETFNQRLGRGS